MSQGPVETTDDMPGVPSLEARSITKRYDRVPVLDGVTFQVPRGRFATLLGPSGCGKTTLLRIIAGLDLPDSGDLRIHGRSMASLPANRRPVNTVFQSYALFPHLSAWDNVAFGLRARGVSSSEVRRKVEDALSLLGLGPLRARFPEQLSGGEKQRVALARALVNEPEVLLLDEPMSALDAQLRRELQVELRALQRKLGTTFLLVTHDQVEAMTVSDEVLVLNRGRIEQTGPPHEVYERPRTRFVAEFLGTTNLLPCVRREEGVMCERLGSLRATVPEEWQSGLLSIRPEKIAISDTEPVSNGVRIAIRDVVYRGDHVDLWVDPALRIRCTSSRKYSVGESLWAALPSEHLHPVEDGTSEAEGRT